MNSFEIRFTCISYIDIQENTKNLYTNVTFSFSFWGTVPHIPYKGFSHRTSLEDFYSQISSVRPFETFLDLPLGLLETGPSASWGSCTPRILG